MGLFRSEPMILCQLFTPPEAAYHTIYKLGEQALVHFLNLNEGERVINLKFIDKVRRCNDMQQRLRFMQSELDKNNIVLVTEDVNTEATNPHQITDLQTTIFRTEKEIRKMTHGTVQLRKSYLDLLRKKCVLETNQTVFNEETNRRYSLYQAMHLEEHYRGAARTQLKMITGIIDRAKLTPFETMLFRLSRGNIFVKTFEINDDEVLLDPTTDTPINSVVFIVFYQGKELQAVIRKVCLAFHGSTYDCPTYPPDRSDAIHQVNQQLEDLEMVLFQTTVHLRLALEQVAKEVPRWRMLVKKMKAIYHIMNYFSMDVTNKCLIGECWVPKSDLHLVWRALMAGSAACGISIPSFLNVIPTTMEPPTMHRLNKFTKGFQNLIDTYGIASYREANPCVTSIVTFPFLFAVMFGDCGHALILIGCGLYLIKQEKKFKTRAPKSEVFRIFYNGRYVILLMGFFSCYTGLMYNDMFSKSIRIQKSSWFVDMEISNVSHKGESPSLDPRKHYTGKPYWFGLDPVWQISENSLRVHNSIKMKLSIVIGILHMVMGVLISVLNFLHFKKYYAIFLEFLPQLIFLCLLFLWLVAMVFIKWFLYDPQSKDPKRGTSCAPSILIYFIDMMLMKETNGPEGCDVFMFDLQSKLQKFLMFGAMGCVPVLLLGKPLYLICKRRHKRHNKDTGQKDIEEGGHAPDSSIGKRKKTVNVVQVEEPAFEIFITQTIHTIEYVLGTVSHTASYLRLWALSLAHAQLSDVAWEQLFKTFPGGPLNAIGVIISFLAWSVISVTLLVVMEGLSAFLHTLRLHWVEFMSKFYIGTGYPFVPFDIKEILEDDMD